ncbi:urease accessory protein UreF [Aliarcobacter butzleri]|uniref:Urease accessory UreF family protein n=1 Tax=Aliarcobacter butzleri TaxID=28197 RepID=A0AAP4PZH2_9BACT|nr:urease accessory UreF family protein [Aliarcobacter butzleri]MDN5052553.1 urease [Aliarcobacter butzleri]MDN5075173.1 urease [Aliarcobacter butzleri]MDN5116825.1 urease accessory UreF family protein [Aliarcobacter butzleri]MDN5132795.1 urease accessory UreF family protein [Aliarcobacter butzleri]NUW27144.1 urease [Aliarcobacter butzleri]
MQKTNLKSLSRFLQILDGSFPSGVFVHSFGLEPHVLKEKVKDINSLKIYLENLIIDQYSKIEFVYVKKIYEALEKEKLGILKKLDNELGAYLTFEFAKASRDIGQNYFVQIKNLASKDIVKEYFSLIENKFCIGNEIIVLSAMAFDMDICLENFIVMWTKKNLINIAVTTLKISRIKPSEIQKMLFEIDEILEKFDYKNIKNKITNFNPLFEEIIFEHKNLEPKLFVT